jgi:hypothetical protein
MKRYSYTAIWYHVYHPVFLCSAQWLLHHRCVCMNVCVCVYVCMCVLVCMCVCVYVCTCVYTPTSNVYFNIGAICNKGGEQLWYSNSLSTYECRYVHFIV